MNDVTPDSLLLIVGAHPRAERDDRPLAQHMLHSITDWLDGEELNGLSRRREPFILTDLWYLNDEALRGSDQPVISIGNPEFNACSAYLANRLPDALVIDGSMRIQFDPEFGDLRACLWGSSSEETTRAVGLFIERHLDPFLQAVHEMTH